VKKVLRVRRAGEVEVPLPHYKTEGSAGMDLCAAIPARITLQPGERALIPTGFAIAVPDGYEGQVRPRSGLALHHGVTVLNSPGTIDSDFTGEVGIVLINHGKQPFAIEPKMRVAQLVIAPIERVDVELVTELEQTKRGDGGYGSTGV
jgi:dUTP diphosphatase